MAIEVASDASTTEAGGLDAAVCARAMAARDPRWDGVFFVGVRSTGIYCRPICPARLPAPSRCRFFARAAQAEAAGFRACLRCRPECAPGHAPVDAVSRLTRRALARIEDGALADGSLEGLARALGVGSRHLRRAFQAEVGVAPVAYAQSRRLAAALRLLRDSDLALPEVAAAAGFSSLRRLHALVRERTGRPPGAHRPARLSRGPAAPATITFRLAHRAPLAWEALLGALASHATPGVERVAGGTYSRVVRVGEHAGVVSVAPDPAAPANRPALLARASLALAPRLATVAARLRALLDLDARPDVIDAHLSRDPLLARLVRRTPGLRAPGALDPFEGAARIVLGQQVSIRAARTLAGRLAASLGDPLAESARTSGRAQGPPLQPDGTEEGLTHAFPSVEAVARARPSALEATGLMPPRARTLLALARAVAEGAIDLDDATDPEGLRARLLEIEGVGPWTADGILLRAIRAPDAFPAGDLGLRRAMGIAGERAALARAEPWRPWRAYAAQHLWHSYVESKAPQYKAL